MTSPLYEDLLQAKMLRGIRESIAEDAPTLEYFGAEGIRLVSYEELEHTIVPPLLAVVTGQAANVGRVISRQANVTYTVPVVLFLPRQTPVNPAVPTPAAPVVSAVAGGSLTGRFSYRATFWNEAGESWASEPTEITLSGGNVSIDFGTIPAGVLGARLWRTARERTAYRYVETIQPEQLAAGWVDDVPDSMLGDEIAPVQLFIENLKDYLRGILYAHETIRVDGVDLCDAALVLADRVDAIDRTRNLRVVGMACQFATIFSVETMQSTADEAP